MIFKTIADIKRIPIGTYFKTIYHRQDSLDSTHELGIRPLVYKDTVKIGFRTDKGSISFLCYPKRNEIKFTGNGFIIINPHTGQKVLTYTYVGMEEKDND